MKKNEPHLYYPYILGTDSPIPYLFEKISPYMIDSGYSVTSFKQSKANLQLEGVNLIPTKGSIRRFIKLHVKSLKEYDLIHTGGRSHYWISQLAHLREPNLSHVHSFRVDVNSRQYPKERKRNLLNKVDATTAVSKHTAKTVKKEFGITPSVIYNGVDNKYFTDSYDYPQFLEKYSIESPYILFVGNFVPRKRPGDVLEVAKQIPEADFLLFGDGPKYPEIKGKANSIQNVTLFGRVDKKILPAIYTHADCFLFPTVREGCPNVVLEAMASGTPVVGYRKTSMPELIEDQETGFLVEESDISGLANKVQILLNS
jgi:glycosyltransferase involved in cell wall biosynthesis